jgi:hypothetical protein
MKHINTWSPDTCGCVLHYEWDDEATPEARIHTAVDDFTDVSGNKRVTQRCPEHAEIASHHEVHEHVVKENQTKNFFLKHILEDHTRFSDIKEESGGSIHSLKKGIKFDYSFTGKGKERTLVAKLHGVTLTPEELNTFKKHALTLSKPIQIQ